MDSKQVPNTVIVDQVLRYPKSGIKVLVVGAGPSGLLSAIECWRKGHDVQIIERGQNISPIGDIIALGPSAIAVFRHYPNLLKKYIDVGIHAESAVFHMDGMMTVPPMEFESNRKDVAPHAAFPIRNNTIIGRYDITNILYKNYEEDEVAKKGKAIAAEGTVYEADIVLAGDGLGSKSQALTLGRPVRAVGTRYSIYRAAMWTSDITDAPLIEKHLQEHPRKQCGVYLGHNQHIILVISERLVSIDITLPNTVQGKALESWSTTIPIKELLDTLPSNKYDPLFIEALNILSDNSIIKWDLCMRDPQPQWSSKNGYVLQVGNSAHSFIPTSGNGATVAMEDGASIAKCLRISGKAGVGLGAKVHELLRFERVCLIQRMGFVNRANFHREEPGAAEQVFDRIIQGKWLWGHRSEEYATERFPRAAARLISQVPFQNTNVPPGYIHESCNLEDEIAEEKAGIVADLTKNGDWSLI